MSSGPWPDGARGALSLSFDNLGEAAEVELGAIPEGAPLGGHFTVTSVLRSILTELTVRKLGATFFVEGLNAEIYPTALTVASLQRQELGYHAWRHEQWADLSAEQQAENLARGLAAFRKHRLDFTGLRPPGGGLGPGGVEVLREAGLRYCSPAGEGAGIRDGIAMLPFQWRHVDATCVLPPLAPVREQMTGSPDPIDARAFLAFLREEIDRLGSEGGYISVVIHPFMREWMGTAQFIGLFNMIRDAKQREDVWVAPCAEVAEHVLANPGRFGDDTVLDQTSWA